MLLRPETRPLECTLDALRRQQRRVDILQRATEPPHRRPHPRYEQDRVTVKAVRRRTGGKHGIVTMCIGGGQGFAAVFSRS